MEGQVQISLAAVVSTVFGFTIMTLIGIVGFFLKGSFAEVKAAIQGMSQMRSSIDKDLAQVRLDSAALLSEVKSQVGRLNNHTTTLQAHEGRISAVERDQSRIWFAIGGGPKPQDPPNNGEG